MDRMARNRIENTITDTRWALARIGEIERRLCRYTAEYPDMGAAFDQLTRAGNVLAGVRDTATHKMVDWDNTEAGARAGQGEG